MITALVETMDETEARLTILAVKSHLISARKLIDDFDARRGWQALGYRSLAHCLSTELEYSESHGYRLEARLRTEAAIQAVHPEAVIKESWVRETGLDKLTAEQQVQVYERARALAETEDVRLTARHISAAVQVVTQREDALPYPLVAHLVTTDKITPERGREMCAALSPLPARQQGLALQLISRHGLGCADASIIAPVSEKLLNGRSLVRQEVLSGRLNGKPLALATRTDLELANEEARLEHIADSEEARRQKAIGAGQIVVQPIIITVFKGDPTRTLKALQRALGDVECRHLFEAMLKE